ncbi:hypothetical protein F0562_027998 [Nyssa sinensis]|uniref:Uncharacterized protein n=1 Tax=Nyssa sinensis TaxID=561372 RepID=A0A5J5B801_9ASTE|nr:hypothetical protein F0562_027998 [Nyssa sinensis]
MGDSDPCDLILDLVQVQVSIGHDLMLFENQLPFFILVELLDMTDVVPATRGYLIKLAWTFLNQMLPSAPTPTYFEYSTISVDDVNHLLGLMHKVFCSSFAEMVALGVTERNGGNQELEFIKRTTELRDAGIKFKILTESSSLLDIKFENCVLKIPPFIVDDNTEPIFRNLITYKQYLPSIYRRYVTDYMIFMDRLINSAKDAEKLRKYGIINNWLGDDEVRGSGACSSKKKSGLLTKSRNWRYRSFFSKSGLRSTVTDLGSAIELPRSTDAQDVSMGSPTVTPSLAKWGLVRARIVGWWGRELVAP